jgi:hypothetical protein
MIYYGGVKRVATKDNDYGADECSDLQTTRSAHLCRYGDPDKARRGSGDYAYSCTNSSGVEYSTDDVSFCTFSNYAAMNYSCGSVCGCDLVYKCFLDCGSYAPKGSASGPTTSPVSSGDLIKASFFNSLVSDLNRIAGELNTGESLSLSVSTGDVIYAAVLEAIPEEINNIIGSGEIGSCDSSIVSNPYLDYSWLDTGKKIRAKDWDKVLTYLNYLSTCCNCNDDYKIVCGNVCVCSCFYGG